MNLVQFKRHDADGDVFINPAHVAMVERHRRRQRDRHRGRRSQAGPRPARRRVGAGSFNRPAPRMWYLGLGEQWNRKYGRRLDLGPPE